MEARSCQLVCGTCGSTAIGQQSLRGIEELNSRLQEFAKLTPTTDFSVKPYEFLLHRCTSQPICERFLEAFYVHQIFIVHDDEINSKTNNLKRKYFYRNVITAVWGEGVLGKGNRVKIPNCVVAIIQTLAPKEDGASFMGYKSVICFNNLFINLFSSQD